MKNIIVENKLFNEIVSKGFTETDEFTIITDDLLKSVEGGVIGELSERQAQIIKANRSHLQKKTITNKNGKTTTVWVNPNKS